MLKVGFAFNFNIQRCEIEVGDENQIVDQGYRPLVDLFKKYGMKADCFVSGYTSELLQKIAPDFLEELKSRKGKEFQFGTYTYTHPIPQLLLPEEFDKQMKKGMELDRSILGIHTKGFLPPEFAYDNQMGEILADDGIEWFVALASQLEKGLAKAGIQRDPYFPCGVMTGNGKKLIAVPAAYQLPDTPARFFKLMMKGELPVDTVIEGMRKFEKQHEGGLLLFKRDAETIFIDFFNSGFKGTFGVLDEFLSKLSKLDFVEPVWIEEVIKECKDLPEISLPDYLGNTKIETFTEGAAKEIWNLTKEVRDKVIAAEKEGKNPQAVEKAWDHLMLSHNSDGRIGYWFSEWNPGEHKVAPTRRQFVEDNLLAAQALLS